MTSMERARQLNAQAAAVALFATSAHGNVECGDWERSLKLLRLLDAGSKQLQQEVVDAMRSDGATWDQVGEVLGVSKQSANARFSNEHNNRRKKKTA